MYSALFTLNTTTEVPLSKAANPTAPRAPQHKWLPTVPGVCSRCVCVHCCVCALWMVHKFRVWVTILGHMSHHFHFHSSTGRGEAQRNSYCSIEETLTTDDKWKITLFTIISTENLFQHHLFNRCSYTVLTVTWSGLSPQISINKQDKSSHAL